MRYYYYSISPSDVLVFCWVIKKDKAAQLVVNTQLDRYQMGHCVTPMLFLRWISWFDPDVGGQGHWKSGQLCFARVRPDRQTMDSFFSKIRTESGQRTESRQQKSGQTGIGHDFPENPEKNETRTGHGQCCPLTSGWTVLDSYKKFRPYIPFKN